MKESGALDCCHLIYCKVCLMNAQLALALVGSLTSISQLSIASLSRYQWWHCCDSIKRISLEKSTEYRPTYRQKSFTICASLSLSLSHVHLTCFDFTFAIVCWTAFVESMFRCEGKPMHSGNHINGNTFAPVYASKQPTSSTHLALSCQYLNDWSHTFIAILANKRHTHSHTLTHTHTLSLSLSLSLHYNHNYIVFDKLEPVLGWLVHMTA